MDPSAPADTLLGQLERDAAAARNERTVVRAPLAHRPRVLRNQYVRVTDAQSAVTFLGSIVAGPFFPASGDADSVYAEIEIQGELARGLVLETSNRPAPGSEVHVLTPDQIMDLLGCRGDMHFGTLAGRPDVPVRLHSKSKNVLPRNVGIFGTVGSGKSNTAQVLIEEAASRGWAVIVVDVEGEYVHMDAASEGDTIIGGVTDFGVLHPASCISERSDSKPFTLRLADFEVNVVAELIQATVAERNALLDCVDHFAGRVGQKVVTTEAESLLGLLDPSPEAKLPYTMRMLRDRANERSSRSSDLFDYLGVSTKLLWLMRSGAFDLQNMHGLSPAEMMQPGRLTIIDVSVANDTVKNLVTADLLRKAFAYKLAKAETPPTLIVIEEAHSFISREKAATMQATLTMLRNVTRRGRKRWLATAFVSQQPGHLPPEIFELCNTRIVHTLRSMHNLDALMATTSDITSETWARCPLLGTGEAIMSAPQLKRSLIVSMRVARSKRKFAD